MRTLGLDMGTNSIGWAILESQGGRTTLIDQGAHIFEKGVKEKKGNEVSLAAERTGYRSARRIKQRRKLRKQLTLRVLVQHDYCPGLTEGEIDAWKAQSRYPSKPEFLEWLATKETTADGKPAGPYYYRWLAVSRKLDINKAEDRYRLGRAFYHLAQRRGYKSNRVEGEDRDGKVAGALTKLAEAMNGRTLGQYYYEDCLGKEPVRGSGHYTARRDYEEEFDKICDVQELPSDLRKALRKAIFFQRPLKSQKGLVGKCVLEPSKPRAPISHPLFEESRAWQFINNIRLSEPGHLDERALSEEERHTVAEWLFRQKKAPLFDKLVKQLVPKKATINYGARKNIESEWWFNYRPDMAAPECKTLARFTHLFGTDWRSELYARYTRRAEKSEEQVVDEIWHVMFSFSDDDKLIAFGTTYLGLDEDAAKDFSGALREGYGSLSLSALRKITPYLRAGLIYSHAVFLANMRTVLCDVVYDFGAEEQQLIADIGRIIERHGRDTSAERSVNAIMSRYRDDDGKLEHMHATIATRGKLQAELIDHLATDIGPHRWKAMADQERTSLTGWAMEQLQACIRNQHEHVKVATLEGRIREYIQEHYTVSDEQLAKLYHPSAMETYPAPKRDQHGRLRLGSPRIASIRNPVFMRTMHRLRHVINALLEQGLIDQHTRVRIEMSRDLTTANERAAIYRHQRELEKRRNSYREEIEKAGFKATESNILKYQLWEEQDHKCVYTDQTISLSEFLGENPIYDIEHTVPRSRRLDNAQTNMTLCDRLFNREKKRHMLPSELAEAEVIFNRACALWADKVEENEQKATKRRNAAKGAADKESKDKAIAAAKYHKLEARYWRDKLRNFEIEEPPAGFTNNQLVDTRIICKYTMQYMKSYFKRVYSVKAGSLGSLRAIWGVEDKSRDSHVHHAKDAIMVAAMSPRLYDELARYFHEYERYEMTDAPKPTAPMPWDGFDTDLNHVVEQNVLVVHHTRNNLLKPTFKRKRTRGRVDRDKNGAPIILRGDSAREALHLETVYGAIRDPNQPADAEDKDAVICVVRKPLKDIKDTSKIIDPAIRRIVEASTEQIKNGKTVWFDEERNIPIHAARVHMPVKQENAIKLKSHRNVSTKPYKQHMHVKTAGTYLTALYRGVVKGKSKPDYKVLTNMTAVQAKKAGAWEAVIPEIDEKGRKLRHILKTGSQVLLWKDSPDELKAMDQKALAKRLYRVTVMEMGLIQFVHHCCALPENILGKGKSKIEWGAETPQSKLRLSANKLNILVEGADFKLDVLGKIHWIGQGDA